MKVIGLMSGTSVDGIDVALVEITGTKLDLQAQLLAGRTIPYPSELRAEILEVCSGKALSAMEFAQLDDAIATQFAIAAQEIQDQANNAKLIGSHGQTIYHQPPNIEQEQQYTLSKSTLGYSWQLGRGAVIANLTGKPTVSNFRAADISAGGQGAPLVSKIDAYLLSHPSKYRAIQNLGGIGNVTLIPPNSKLDWEKEVSGWDTGPGNMLLDLAVKQLTNGNQSYDHNGEWAAQGTPNKKLVNRWLEHKFFQQAPPKSTGRELFGQAYLAKCWQDAQQEKLNSADWLATLSELTIASVVHSYQTFCPQIPEEILLCGGGSRNLYLRQRLETELTSTKILTTDEVGLDGDYKEAIAFAILAYWRFQCSIPGNLPQVTGAKKPMLLGEIHLPLI